MMERSTVAREPARMYIMVLVVIGVILFRSIAREAAGVYCYSQLTEGFAAS